MKSVKRKECNMRITPCTYAMCSNNVPSTSVPKKKLLTPPKLEPVAEKDYGKGMKQLSYIIGMSILGVSSIILGTRGKFCGIKL